MKPDHLTAEMTADSLNDAVERIMTPPGGPSGRVGKRPARMLARQMSLRTRQSGKPATTLPLNERRILHDLFQQEPGLESRSKALAGDRKAAVLQKRG